MAKMDKGNKGITGGELFGATKGNGGILINQLTHEH